MREPTTKVILVGDFIVSKHDGEQHFVSGERLAQLYGYRPGEYIVADARNPESYKAYPNLPRLYPRWDGNYRIRAFRKGLFDAR